MVSYNFLWFLLRVSHAVVFTALLLLLLLYFAAASGLILCFAVLCTVVQFYSARAAGAGALILCSVLYCFAIPLSNPLQCYSDVLLVCSAVLLLVASAQCGVKRTRTEARHPAAAYHHANNC